MAGYWLFLHGILGSGSNWRTIAKRLVAQRQELGAVLVDLRLHGQSQGARPPHTVEAAAADLEALCDHLAKDGRKILGVVGHSFGGKVALAFRQITRFPLESIWVLDSSPSAQPEAMSDAEADSPVRVLRALAELPTDFADRAAFITAMTERGFSEPLGQWLAMNLEHDDDRYRLRFDLSALGELLADYYARDAWPAVESRNLPGRLGVVVAGKSEAVPMIDRQRLADLASEGRIGYIEVGDVGHWLHVEAPARVVQILAKETDRTRRITGNPA